MDAREIKTRRDEVAQRYGEWTAHSIRLADGVLTRADGGGADRVRRCLQIAVDVTRRPLDQLRVLDLGALEGQYGVEFALHGAEVVAVEGREANIEKARVARDALDLDRLELRHEDVRDLSRNEHGTFDVVLCVGLLYHLAAEDVFRFLEQLAEVCSGVLILDTHVALRGRVAYRHGEREYRGLQFTEHDPRASRAQRERSLWASLDNPESFWPTRVSLFNALEHAGFSSVMTVEVPAMDTSRDRVTLVAVQGTPVELASFGSGVDGRHPVRGRRPRMVRNQSRVFLWAKRLALRGMVVRDRLARPQ